MYRKQKKLKVSFILLYERVLCATVVMGSIVV